MREHLDTFVQTVAAGKIDIYNEFSLQHEFGIHLRSVMKGVKIQFERNVSFFSLQGIFVKKEIDLIVFGPDRNDLKYAIEFKYPRNGQHPEQMYKFCEDINFLEQLKRAGFQRTYFVAFADDRLFYEGKGGGIYDYFRKQQPLTGKINKPTGTQAKSVNLTGNYKIVWEDVVGSLKFTFISV